MAAGLLPELVGFVFSGSIVAGRWLKSRNPAGKNPPHARRENHRYTLHPTSLILPFSTPGQRLSSLTPDRLYLKRINKPV
jgi:hypothetical protein